MNNCDWRCKGNHSTWKTVGRHCSTPRPHYTPALIIRDHSFLQLVLVWQPSRGTGCFALEMNWAVEFRFFFLRKFPISAKTLQKYEGRSINQLQNNIILLIFKIWKIRNIGFVHNLIVSNSCEFDYNRVTYCSINCDLPRRDAEFNEMLHGIHRIFPQKTVVATHNTVVVVEIYL